jgi:serine/threonine protein kinase
VPLHPGATIQFGSTVLSLSLQHQVPLPDLQGQLIDGRYRLLECLQQSPKGVVYRAEKQPAGVAVAVKILSPDYAGYPGYRERFAAEARIAAQLQHPHVCRLDDFGETELVIEGRSHRVPYSAYPILAGGSLAERVADFGTLGLDTIERWITDAGEALAYAHAAGVVHGNLKPAALCFDRELNLYLTDFALAGGGATGPALFGTPAYMAPEQWRGEPAGPASDQYALAAIAYHLLAGRKPFDGQEDPDRRAANLAEGPPPVHQLALQRFKRTLPTAASAVLAKGLAAEPGERHASVLELAQALSQALRSNRSHRARQAFISYRREDSAILATFIADQLQGKHEISAFVDTQGLDGATRFPTRIERAIQDCEVFICILGAHTLESVHVLREIQQAHAAGKPMIPVFQEDYAAPDEAGLDPAVADLLQFDGIPLLDKRNVYVHAAVAELAQQVRHTLRRR